VLCLLNPINDFRNKLESRTNVILSLFFVWGRLPLTMFSWFMPFERNQDVPGSGFRSRDVSETQSSGTDGSVLSEKLFDANKTHYQQDWT